MECHSVAWTSLSSSAPACGALGDTTLHAHRSMLSQRHKPDVPEWDPELACHSRSKGGTRGRWPERCWAQCLPARPHCGASGSVTDLAGGRAAASRAPRILLGSVSSGTWGPCAKARAPLATGPHTSGCGTAMAGQAHDWEGSRPNCSEHRWSPGTAQHPQRWTQMHLAHHTLRLAPWLSGCIHAMASQHCLGGRPLPQALFPSSLEQEASGSLGQRQAGLCGSCPR